MINPGEGFKVKGGKGTPYIVGGKVNWCSHFGKQYGGDSLKN